MGCACQGSELVKCGCRVYCLPRLAGAYGGRVFCAECGEAVVAVGLVVEPAWRSNVYWDNSRKRLEVKLCVTG